MKLKDELIPFSRYLILMQLPIYGSILWMYLFKFGLQYWVAWFLANCTYTIMTYPIVRLWISKRQS